MKYNNLKVIWKKIAAVAVAGTMLVGFAGCEKKNVEEDPEAIYVQMVDEGLDDFLKTTKDYTKARDLYIIYPSIENLNNLKNNMEILIEKINDKLREKLGVEFCCYVYTAENGDKTYTVTDKNNPKVAYTHFVSSDGKSFGEIESPLILNALTAPSKVPLKSTANWSKKEITNFLQLGEEITENAKKIFITDFEINNGSICEVEPEIGKKLIQQKN